jgi:hypothetical protein
MGFYIPEDDILHSHCREYLKSYETLTCPDELSGDQISTANCRKHIVEIADDRNAQRRPVRPEV